MNWSPELFSSNSSYHDGNLAIAGIPASVLADEYGTPLFVIDENDFRTRAAAWKSSLERHFGTAAGTVYYAGKAFLCVEVAKWINQAGIGLDVCTGGELSVAIAAEFPPSRLQIHGNNKSEEEIAQALQIGAGTIVIDSFHEIERVNRLAKNAGVRARALLRLTPGIEAHTHEFIATAHEDVKFGFSIASGAAWRAVEECEAASNIDLMGLHAHIGSQIFSADGFEASAGRLLEFMGKYRDHFNRQLPELDLGGGYGIAYVPGEESVDPDYILSAISKVVKDLCKKLELALPKISIEPGRAIVGPTTTTLYEVGTTKMVVLDDGATRRYVAVDGGMSDNIRPALYDAEYTAILANRNSDVSETSTRIVGKHCESGDIIIRDIDLPADIDSGDLLAIPATGAYGRSMASNYNHMPRPAMVAVIDGTARIILRRESYEDLLALDVQESARKLS